MEDFIGNNARVIVQWGQLITAAIIFICTFLLYRDSKEKQIFSTKRFLGLFICGCPCRSYIHQQPGFCKSDANETQGLIRVE